MNAEHNAARFAQLVAGGMRRKNLSLRACCRLVGVDPSLFSKILAGKRNPPDDDAVIEHLALSLELDADELFVSVNRIPPAWRPACADPSLLAGVRGMLSVPEAARRAPARVREAERKPELRPAEPDTMPEELL